MNPFQTSPSLGKMLLAVAALLLAAPFVFDPKAPPQLRFPLMLGGLVAAKPLATGWVRTIWMGGVAVAALGLILDLIGYVIA